MAAPLMARLPPEGAHAMQALLSARGIMKELAGRGLTHQHRLAHCSSPGDSVHVVAVHGACERLSAELRELGRDPVLPTRSQVGQPAVHTLAALLVANEHFMVHCCSPEEQARYSTGLPRSAHRLCFAVLTQVTCSHIQLLSLRVPCADCSCTSYARGAAGSRHQEGVPRERSRSTGDGRTAASTP